MRSRPKATAAAILHPLQPAHPLKIGALALAGGVVLALLMHAVPAFADTEPTPTEEPAKVVDPAAKPEMTPEEAAKKAAEACPDGKVMDADKKECVEATPGTEKKTLWQNGRDFANAGQYERAIRTLELAEMSNDARVLSYLGFSHRKLGHLMVAMGYYEAAIAADPDYVKVREYMGEGMLQMGNTDGARGQLAEIGKRCGTGCAEYVKLAGLIMAADTARN